MVNSKRMNPHLSNLLEDYRKLVDFNGISSLLSWDQETYMPSNALDTKSRQRSLIAQMGHDLFTSDDFEKKLLSDVADKMGFDLDSLNDDDDEVAE